MHWEVRHAGSGRRNPIRPRGNSPVFSTKLCSVNKGVRERCPADPYHLKSKACRRQMIKIKQPYIENGIEPKFSMPRVNVLIIQLKEGVCRGAPVLTEMFGLGPAKCLLDLEWNVGLFPRKQKQNFQWSALYLFRPALEPKISIPAHTMLMLPKSEVLIQMQDGQMR